MKKNKIFALVLMILMFVTNIFPVVTFADSSVNVIIGTAEGNVGDTVVVPVNFQGITAGINNCDFILTFDSNILELEEITPGIIVPNAVSNFSAHSGKPGVVSFLFCDSTQGLLPITINGSFANLKFKIKNNSANGSYEVKMSSSGAFSDSRGGKINATFTSGSVKVSGDVIATPTPAPTSDVKEALKISVENVNATAGQIVTVPIKFENVPSSGINNCDFKLKFDENIFSLESVAPGSIVTNPSSNFYSYVKSDGTIAFLFSDSTVGSNQINKDGIFASLKLKVSENAEAKNYELLYTNIGSVSSYNPNIQFGISPIPAVIDGGMIFVTNAGNPTTPPVVTKPKINISIGAATGEAGSEISIPVVFESVPDNGINNCDFKVSYDSSVLEIKGVEAGNIVPSSSVNFNANYNKEGLVQFLYNDSTQGSNPISSKGVFATIKAVIKNNAKAGTYDVKLSQIGAFSSKNMVSVEVAYDDGKVVVTSKNITPTPVPTKVPSVETMGINVEDASGQPGSVITIPVKFSDVPSVGVNNCDFRLSYNKNIIEIVEIKAGSIVPNPIDFVGNKTDEDIFFLYNDQTQGSNSIVKDGVFANIDVKIKENAPAGKYQINFKLVGSVSGKNMTKIDVTKKDGVLTVEKADTTISPQPTTAMATPTATPTVVPGDLKVKVDIGTVTAEGGFATVPIKFVDVPGLGINNCDFELSFDNDQLSVEKIEPGEIVPLSDVNFSAYNPTGKIKILFNDGTQGQYLITKDGVFATIKFKVLNPSTSGNYSITYNESIGTFSCKGMVKAKTSITNGKVIVIGTEEAAAPTSTPIPVPTATPTTRATATPTATATATAKVTVTPTATPVNSVKKLNVEISSIKGVPGDTVDVPVYLKGVTSDGINNCNFSLVFDKNAFEVVSVTAGSIVTNPATNFIGYVRDEYIKILFNDETAGNMPITQDGEFAVIKVKIKDNAVSGSYKLAISDVGAFSSFKNRNMVTILPAFTGGDIEVGATNVATPIPSSLPAPATDELYVVVGNVSGKAGSTVTVPVTFTGINENGLRNCDFRLQYDESALEVVNVDAGIITTLPIANFVGYAGKAGYITFLFNDATQGSMPIKDDGVFANITFKLKTDVSEGSGVIKVTGDKAFSDSKGTKLKTSIIVNK